MVIILYFLKLRHAPPVEGESKLAIIAVQHIRAMRGGAQGQLMLGADGHAYVVKFQNNPQHRRVLANEFLASRLALAVGLAAPEAVLMDVSSWLVENTPELEIDLGRTHIRCQPGLQFGSRFVGGMMPGGFMQSPSAVSNQAQRRAWEQRPACVILSDSSFCFNRPGKIEPARLLTLQSRGY